MTLLTPHDSLWRKKYRVRAVFRSVAFIALVIGFSTFNFIQRQWKPDNQVRTTDQMIINSHSMEQQSLPSYHTQPLHMNYNPPSSFFNEIPSSSLPRQLLACDEIKKAEPTWMIVFYILGVLYMFLCLAIVCDELFVPALEVMADEHHLNLSMDVAGATLMAAGGSAPELFTSVIGTFQESDVGIGTIVGSAVFNVLFVIGMCSLLSKEVLTLTWWPLLRDCTYYVSGLLMLAVFVGVISPEKIYIWEAAVLFIMYIGYVVMMKYNRLLYTKLTGKVYVDPGEEGEDTNQDAELSKPSTASVPVTTPAEDPDTKPSAQLVQFQVESFDESRGKGLIRGDSAKSMNSIRSATSRNSADISRYTHGRWPGTFRAGILKLLRVPHSWVETAGVGLVGLIAGDVHAVFNHFDKNGDGVVDKDELGVIFQELGHTLTKEELEDVFTELDEDDSGNICKAEFTKWYVRSEELILSKVKETFERFDEDKNGVISRDELKTLLVKLEPCTTEKDIDDALKACYKDGSTEEITYDEFSQWYIKSLLYDRQKKYVEEEVDAIFANLKPPQDGNFWSYVVYLIYLPIVFTLAFTVPDVRRDGWAKFCYLSFLLSIVWIGVYSYFMVSWAEIIGNTIGIPSVVMGLTFLAAGTSVPDLLTSVIVARRGEGDMAISSSIGSNIFDILVGLPLPWILYTAWPTKPSYVRISAQGIWINILILLGMVVLIIFTINCAGWKLTKKVGFAMFIMYFIFLAQAIVQELPFKTCT